ncbi:MAG: hypothetical protein IIA49_00305 [Bacteroidetes bacterium]|nr:hypothetical protein [Bacteroidota bacterium]
MKNRVEVIINKSREEVWGMFDSIESLYKWQPSFKEFKVEGGEAGKPGAKSRL